MTLTAAADRAWRKTETALREQLDGWLLRSGVEVNGETLPDPQQALPENRSQIERLTQSMGDLLDAVVAAEATTTDPLAEAEVRRDGVHAAAVIWEFFRSRLAQRDSDDLRAPLYLADDVAYQCWLPLRDAAISARTIRASHVREPPLCTFGSFPGPVVWSRGKRFPVARLEAPWDRVFDDAIRELEIPVVELPWSEVVFVPTVITIAHEIGHVAEQDFGLDPSLNNAGARWGQWQSEILADYVGLCGGGAGFLAALVGALSGERLDVAANDVDPHPPPRLRMRLMFALAHAIGVEGTAEVETAWAPHAGNPSAEASDIPNVVSLLDRKLPSLGTQRVHEVLQPPSLNALKTFGTNHVLASAAKPPGRLLAAGAAWAWLNKPEQYDAVDERKLVESYARVRQSGVRAKPIDRGALAPPDPRDADRARVRRLLRTHNVLPPENP